MKGVVGKHYWSNGKLNFRYYCINNDIVPYWESWLENGEYVQKEYDLL